jgi:plasmid stabilization system protein ParE
MYDCVILSGDAFRSLEDAWREYARRSLLQAAAVVRPLRVADETALAVARAAGVLNDDGVSDRSTTSFVASTDDGSGSTADSVSES